MSQLGSDPNPPMSSEFQVPIEPPAWPKVVGIISIVLGSLGIPCSGCISVMTFSGSAFYEWGRQKQIKANMPDPGAMPAVFMPHGLDLVAVVLWFIGVVVLLVAGIMTVKRAASGRAIHFAYAAISILGTLVYVGSSLMKVGAIASWIAQNPGHPFLKQPGTSMAANPAGAIVSGLICLVYPIFCVVWFGMLGKRPEVGAPAQEPLV